MSIGRQDYEERREARADRLEERARKAAGKAADAFCRSEDAVRGIPAGQPSFPEPEESPSGRHRSVPGASWGKAWRMTKKPLTSKVGRRHPG